MPLSKSSVSLKTDTSSKLYKSVWTSSDDTVIKVSGTTYFSTKVTHPDFKDGATDEYYNEQDASKLKGSTQYTLTVSAEGYVRNVQKVTLSEDTNMDVVIEKGATVNFNVYQASGKKPTML